MSRGGTILLNPSRGRAVRLVVESPPERSGGVGGWVGSERARRRAAKWYRALPDDTYSWNLILDEDALPGTSTISERLRWLRDMGQPGNYEEPPTIEITGDVWDDDANVLWVMDGLTLGDRLFNPDGSFRRHHVTVQLSRYVAVDEIAAIRVTPTRTGRKRTRRTVVVKQGDTLRAIALRELGNGSRWKEVVAWNKAKLRGVLPDVPLRAGVRLVVADGERG